MIQSKWPAGAADVLGGGNVSFGTTVRARTETFSGPGHHLARRQMRGGELHAAYGLSFMLVSAAVLLTPFAQTSCLNLPSFMACYMTGSVILNSLVGILLLSKGRIEADRSHDVLAMAYFFAAFIVVPYTVAFPDALRPGILFGRDGSSIWLWTFWHIGFAIFVIRYGLSRWASALPFPPWPAVLGMVLLLVGAAAAVALYGTNQLPVLLKGHRFFDGSASSPIICSVLLLNIVAAGVVAARFRHHRAEDLWLTVGLIGACAEIWLTLCGGQRYTLGWYGGRLCGLSTSFVLLVSLMNDILLKYGSAAAANDVLDRMTLTDPLTRLGNRRMFDNLLQKEWRRCRRDGLPLSIVLFDVDHFKAYNDTYGHQAGDACLQELAARLGEAAARAGDLATRYGGEEFALILPTTDSTGAEYLARQVRMTVRDLAMPHRACENRVITLSAGVATLVPSESFGASELVRLADLALYRAKAAGRDKVAVAG